VLLSVKRQSPSQLRSIAVSCIIQYN